MPDTSERIAILEANMANVLATLSKREDYQASVLKQLTVIEMKQDQALAYQKHCDAERAAHGSRLGTLENQNADRANTRKVLLVQVSAVSAAVGFFASAAAVLSLVHR